MKLLNQLKQELGMSIILVTHDLGVIAQIATGWPSCMPARSWR